VQSALGDFQAAYRIFGKAHEPRSQAIVLQNIGSIYHDARDYDKALQYYAQAAETYPQDVALLVSARNNIGYTLTAQKKYAEAVAEFERAREIARAMQSPMLRGNILTNQAAAEVEWGRLDEAQRHLDEAMALSRQDPGGAEWRSQVYGVAARVQLKRGQPRAAAQLVAKTFSGVDIDSTNLLFRDFHETAYLAYSQLGDDRRALAHLKAFKRLDDSARELAASTNAALMAARFDYANQSARIAKLKAERDMEQAEARSTIIAVLLAGSLLVGVLLAAAVISIRRSRNAVRAANTALSVANRSLEKAVQARTEFLATTSHEIRTPLNGILGMTQVILSNPGLDADLREKIGLVHGSGETMRALVDDILDISKIETGKMEIHPAEMNLKRLCEDTLALWSEKAEAKGVTITGDLEDAPVDMLGDATRLRQILFNLMSNAVKFTHVGEVRLSVHVAGRDGFEELRLSVADTGIGIPAERLGDVFEPFRQVDGSLTRSYEGTGLGLAICRNLARAMDGDIDLKSTLGEGSTFTLRMPLHRACAPESAGEEAAPGSLDQARVLVVEANPLTQAVLRAVLQPQVRAIETVASCAGAGAESSRFDLIVVEAGVLGGDAAARAAALAGLAAATAPAMIAVLLGEAAPGEAAQLTAAGADQVIRKPIAAPALAEVLRTGFAERRERQSDARASSAA
jgi:signal transduction histidine kinase